MQTAADRVDSDLREAQAARGLPGVPLRRRVMVAVDGRGQSEYLVRVGPPHRRAPRGAVDRGHRADRRRAERGAASSNSTAPSPWRAGSAARPWCCAAPASSTPCWTMPAARGVPARSCSAARASGPVARMFNRTLTQQLIQRGAHFELTIVSTPEARARARRALRGAGRLPQRAATRRWRVRGGRGGHGAGLDRRALDRRWTTCRWSSSSRWCWWPRARAWPPR